MGGRIEEAIRRCFREPESEEALTSFDDLFRPHAMVALLRIAPHSPALIEDAYQEAFIKYIRIFRERREPQRNFANYLLVVAKNELIDQLRAHHRANEFDDLWFGLFGKNVDRTDPLKRLVVLEAMMALEPRCLYALENFYLAGTDASEIAKALNLAPASLYVHLARCRDALGRLLST